MKTAFFDSDEFYSKCAAIENGFEFFDWISSVPVINARTGNQKVFEEDDFRPNSIIEEFKDIRGWKILELGMLEAGHTYQLEKMGANLTAIDAHPENFLKSLVVKNALDMHAKILLGDFASYVKETKQKFDLIFASGVLYHMEDPIRLLIDISKRTDRLFIWTHYMFEEIEDSEFIEAKNFQEIEFKCNYYKYCYDLHEEDRSYAGITNYSNRVTKEALLGALSAIGWSYLKIIKDEVNHPGGPNVSLVASK